MVESSFFGVNDEGVRSSLVGQLESISGSHAVSQNLTSYCRGDNADTSEEVVSIIGSTMKECGAIKERLEVSADFFREMAWRVGHEDSFCLLSDNVFIPLVAVPFRSPAV
ncbi:hypothetical protein OUZ56_013221 [Daphnia magna]|uniref:Uncharacterized protein n=1 Tax=Daphnia magna TaxID=35525 RepID=A0ABQ9Z6H5_9CRUS|nr:hypothetical protein OUZ56_013221 [Daphnia magna]